MSDSNAATTARQALRGWFSDEPFDLRPMGEGHIHSTWRVVMPAHPGSEQRQYVLQKINPAVFAQPAELMANLQQLFVGDGAGSVVGKAAGEPAVSLNYQLPQPLSALSGASLVSAGTQRLADGSVVDTQWRLAAFIEQSKTLQLLSDTQQAEAAGRAFGEFQHWLEPLVRAPLVEVIPGFHQIERYVATLHQVSLGVKPGASAFAARERSLLLDLRERDYLPPQQPLEGQSGELGSGVIHGDCKVNNLLFDEDAERVVAILDLDTLMRGPWWLDFGDLVRSATCTDAGEFQREFYPALAEGFFKGRAGSKGSVGLRAFDLTAALRAPAHMTYMLCVRFLTDHLRGDRYFNVEQRGDNLVRAERQFRLLKTLESDDTQGFMRDVLRHFL